MAKKTGLSLKNIFYTCCERLMVHLQQREVNIDEAKLTLQGLTVRGSITFTLGGAGVQQGGIDFHAIDNQIKISLWFHETFLGFKVNWQRGNTSGR